MQQLGGGSLSDVRECSAPPLKAPKKTVRFSADTPNADESSADSTGVGQHPGPRPARDSGVYSPAAGGEGCWEVAAADPDKDCGEVAVDAERHGLLPTRQSTRLKMPVVEWFSDIGTGTWRDVSYAILVSIATPAAFAPLAFALTRLTWVPGLILLVAMWGGSYYNAMLLADLHTWTVTMRQCRYRDLARSIWGDKGLYTVYMIQLMACISRNIAIQLSCALIMKDLHNGFHPDAGSSVFVYIAIFSSAQLLLSQLPTMRHLRHLNVAAVMCTAAFVIIVSVKCIAEGRSLDRSNIQHSLDPQESTGVHTLRAFEAIGVMAYAFSNPIMPEIQSIAKPPAKQNGYKGISAAYAFVLVAYLTLAVSAYWAFGDNVSQLVVLSIKPVTNWTVAAAEIMLVVNGALNYQIYARPSFEILGLLLEDPMDPNLMSVRNCIARLAGTSVYILTIGYVTAILPSRFDEILSIVGVIGYVPLDLVLPLLLYNSARKPRWPRRAAHIAGSVLAIVAGVCAITGTAYSLYSEAQSEGMNFFGDVDPRAELSNVEGGDR